MMSMAMTRWSLARSLLEEDQDAALPVKPCKSTSGVPLPCSSTWKSMPLARTMLISHTNRCDSPQLLGDSGPDCPMLRHVSGAIGDQLNDRQAIDLDGVTELAAEGDPIPGSHVRCRKEPSGRGNVETGRRPEQCFENWRVELFSLGKKRKDPAAVVVEYDNSGIESELCRGIKTVQIVKKAEVADDQDDWAIGDGGGAERSGNDAVDSVCPAVAHDSQLSPVAADEGVDVADRHAVANDKSRALGKECRNVRNGAAFKRVSFLRQRGFDCRCGGPVYCRPCLHPPTSFPSAYLGDFLRQCRERHGRIRKQVARRQMGRVAGCAVVDHHVQSVRMGQEELL